MDEEKIEAILRAAGAKYRHMGHGVNAWCMDGDLMPLIEALLAAPACVSGACRNKVACDDAQHCLHTNAAPAAPLTDEQIRAERDRIGAAFGFMDGVRYAERAHGIKP